MPLPAPTWAALYDFPGNVASAWGSILGSDSVTLIGSDTMAHLTSFIIGPRANETIPKDCITYTAQSFTQASDQQVRSSLNGQFFFAHYAGTITTQIRTPRGAGGDSAVTSAAAEHGNRVGRITVLAMPAALRFTAGALGVLPYYEVLYVDTQVIPNAVPDDEQDIDVTALVSRISLWIRPDAFPAVLP